MTASGLSVAEQDRLDVRGLMRPPFRLWRMIEDAAVRTPDGLWATGAYGDLTYAEGWAAVRRCASALSDLGVGDGDRVVLCMPNHPAFGVVLNAVWLVGGAGVALHPAYAEPTQAAQVRLADPRLIVGLAVGDLAGRVARLGEAASCGVLVVDPTLPAATMFAGHAPLRVPADADDDALALLQFTGGTTGHPKAARLTHANVSTNLGQMALVIERMQPGREKALAAAPFAHITGLNAVLNQAAYFRGAIVYMEPGPPSQIARTCLVEGVSLLVGPPTLLQALCDCAPADATWAINYVISGGAPLPIAVKDRFEAVTGAEVLNGYGLSETSPAVSLFRPGDHFVTFSAGRPAPGTEVHIVNPDDGSPMASGETGEICVSGPQVMSGYWRDAEATDAAIRHGRLHTGDLGYLSPDGQLFIVDRLKDIIIASGYNIYPANVENALYRHPDIVEAAVIGVPHAYRGETVRAVVVLRDGADLTLEDLREFLRPMLSPMELPGELEAVAELPKSPAGKILRRMVKERASVIAPGGL